MGKTRCPPCDCPQVLPLWLGTYGDMVTLILTFFILILSMVTFDAKKLTEAEGSMKGAMSLLSGGIKTEPDNTRIQQQADMTTEPESAEEVKKIESEILDFKENVRVSLGPSNIVDDGSEGFILRFSGKLLFEKGETTLYNEEEILFLKRLALILQKMPANLHADVIGYTDNSPITPTTKYK
ncbi:flagellar motor protein MotB, partial [Helicobacter ganmani]